MTRDSEPETSHSSSAEKKFKFVDPAEGAFRTYTNHHQVGWTAYDVRLLFGELLNVSGDEVVIQRTAHVTMSWRQAKQLAETVQSLVRDYEARNGPIEPVDIP